LTEIPEHLLARSKQRRSALTGEGDAGPAPVPATTEEASTPATTGSAAPAPAVAPAPEPEPEPTPPWVEAARSRKKVPIWAAPVLVALPVFFIVYALTLDEPVDDAGALVVGGEVYAVNCAGCHGGGGGGGVGPQLSGGAVVENFPLPADLLAWVALGSNGFRDLGFDSYGALDTPIAGGMPGQEDLLEPEVLMDTLLYVRQQFGGEEFDAELWADSFEETITELVPDRAEEYLAVLEEWTADPPT